MDAEARSEAATAAVLSALERRGWKQRSATSDELGSTVSISHGERTGVVRLMWGWLGGRRLGLARIDVGDSTSVPLASSVWRSTQPDLWNQSADEGSPPYVVFQGAIGEDHVSIAAGTIGAENHEGELWRRAAQQLAEHLDELRPGIETRWSYLAAREGAAAPARRENVVLELVRLAAIALFFGFVAVVSYSGGTTAGVVIGSVVCTVAVVGFGVGLWVRGRDKARALRALGSCVEGLEAGGFDRIEALAHTGAVEHVPVVLANGPEPRASAVWLRRIYYRALSSRHPLVANLVHSRVEWKETLEPCKIVPELWVTTRIEGPAEWLAKLPRRRAEHRSSKAVVWIDGPHDIEARALRRALSDFGGRPDGAPYR